MHNTLSILNECFKILSSTEYLERVSVSVLPKCRQEKYLEVWRLTTEIDISDCAEDIIFYVAFLESFPYEIPDIYYLDTKYDYLPHIGYEDRKLCLYDNGICYDIEQPELVIRACIKQAKNIIKSSATGIIPDDFINEIESHWEHHFDKEPNVDDQWIILNAPPADSHEMEWATYQDVFLGAGRSTKKHTIVYAPENTTNSAITEFLSECEIIKRGKALYLPHISIPKRPPYLINFATLLNMVDPTDIKLIKTVVNKNTGIYIIFPLQAPIIYGGVYVPSIQTKQKGFREQTPFYIYTKLANKKKPLQRIQGRIYSNTRIAERTAGRLESKYSFYIAGLGSVGSNLVNLLRGFNNCSFTFADKESLSIDNIGRHLLGFSYIDQSKAYALKHFLKSTRPDLQVEVNCKDFHEILSQELNIINEHSCLFVLTGDQMIDMRLLAYIKDGKITTPVFMIWIEPFAIAGHMVYINPKQNLNVWLYDENLNYKYNLIASSEYNDEKKVKTFLKKTAGCNSQYAEYSGNDINLLLAAFYPHIVQLIQKQDTSKCIRWIGNTELAKEKEITLTESRGSKGDIQVYEL